MRRSWLIAWMLLPVLALAAEPGTAVVEYSVDPKDADPEVTDWLEPHLAVRDAAVPSNGLLFLFLAGHRQIPSDYQLILRAAAHRGYWALGLRYANSWAVKDIIDSSPDCTRAGRMEIFDGQGEAKLGIAPADSIVWRLISVLKALAKRHPADAWGRFLSEEEPVWKAITVAGHSFGGGEAELISTLHPVHRVVLFSSPDDHCKKSRGPPPWIDPQATPGAAHYGMGHLEDPAFDLQRHAWTQLGMLQHPASDRDVRVPPYAGAHVLTTRAPAQTASKGDAHRSTVEDAYTPLDGASPLFEGSWEYLVGP